MTVGVVQRASHSQAMRMYVLGRGGGIVVVGLPVLSVVVVVG